MKPAIIGIFAKALDYAELSSSEFRENIKLGNSALSPKANP